MRSTPSHAYRLAGLCRAFLVLLAAMMMMIVPQVAQAQSPINLFWTGEQDSNFLNPNNWRNGSNQVVQGIAPFFLFNNNLIFTGVRDRHAIYSPPRGEQREGDIVIFDYTNGSIVVNRIELRADYNVPGSPRGRLEIRATPQARAISAPADQNPKSDIDFAGIITNQWVQAGGEVRIVNTNYTSVAVPADGEVKSVAEVLINGPATMSGGVLTFIHVRSNLEQAFARMVVADRRIQVNGNPVRDPNNRGHFNWSGGTINFQSEELLNATETRRGQQRAIQRRASLEIEGDWNQSGNTAIGDAMGLVALVNTELGQSINAGGTPDGTARFPALQITQQNVTLAAGRKINCKGAFQRFGQPREASMIINGLLTLQGAASIAPGDPDILMVGGLTVGPSTTAGLRVGDNRRIRGNGGSLNQLGGDIDITGSNSEVDIRGPFIIRDAALTQPVRLTVNGPNSALKLAGWDVIDNAISSEFTAVFSSTARLEITGGAPTTFRTTGLASVTWPGTVIWGDSTQPNLTTFAEWHVGPNSRNFKTLRIRSTPSALFTMPSPAINLERLIIEANGKLAIFNNQTINVTAATISNSGLITIGAGRIIGINESLTPTNASNQTVVGYDIGQTARAIVRDSDKNLDGTIRDFLINPLNGQGMVVFEVLSQGTVAEREEFNQTSGRRVFQETANTTFRFDTPGLPILERIDNNSVNNDGELRALDGDVLRMTYTDPNGDQTVRELPIRNPNSGNENVARFPDLTIDGFSLNVVNQTVTFTTQIRNAGTAPSNPTWLGLFRNRGDVPTTSDAPNFTAQIPRIPAFLAADTLELRAQNDDTPFIPALQIQDVQGAPAPRLELNGAPYFLPPPVAALLARGLKNSPNPVLTVDPGSTPLSLPTPGTAGQLIQAFEIPPASFNTVTVSNNANGATAALRDGAGIATQGTRSLGVDVNFGAPVVPSGEQTVTVSVPTSITLGRPIDKVNLRSRFLVMDIRGDAALAGQSLGVDLSLVFNDGKLVRFSAPDVDFGLLGQSSFANNVVFRYVSNANATGQLSQVQSVQIHVTRSPGANASGSIFFDNLRILQPALLALEYRSAALNEFVPLYNEYMRPDGARVTVGIPFLGDVTQGLRVRVVAGDSALNLPASRLSLDFADNRRRTISIPGINSAVGAQSAFWIGTNGATYQAGGLGETTPNLGLRVAGAAPTPSMVRLESNTGSLLVELLANTASSHNLNNPASLGQPAPARVRVIAGNTGQDLSIPAVDLIVRDQNGRDRRVLLPALTLTDGGTSRSYWVSLNGSTYNTNGLDTTPNFGSLARGRAIGQSAIALNAVAGTDYYIVVDGKRQGATLDLTEAGHIQLNWDTVNPNTNPANLSVALPLTSPGTGAPANDFITDFQFVGTAAEGRVAINNSNATKQAQEPDHAGNRGGRSVWYMWRAPSSGTFYFHTFNSEIDTLLAAYTAPQPITTVTLVVNAYEPGQNLQAWALADVFGEVTESAEDNNFAGPGVYSVATPPFFGPDLVIDSFQGEFVPGANRVDYLFTVRNGGTQGAAPSRLGLYFNRATAPNIGDIPTQVVNVPTLGPNEVANLEFSLPNPAPGVAKSWAFANYDNTIAEFDNTNNKRFVDLDIPFPPEAKPDLLVDTFSAAVTGSQVKYAVKVQNNGTLPAGATLAFLYFDRNAPPTASDPADAFIPVSALAPGALFSTEFTRNSVDAGVYTSWILLDGQNLLDELDKANNVGGTGQFAVVGTPEQADLVVTSVLARYVDPYTDIIATVANRGGTTSPACSLALFFNRSTPPASGASADVILPVPALEPGGEFVAIPIQFTVRGLAPGDYQAWAFVDSSNNVVESNNANNARGGGFFSIPSPVDAILPDLIVEALSASTSGLTITYRAVVKNQGNFRSEATQLAFFPSLAARPTSLENAVRSFDVGPLDPGQRQLISFTRTQTPAGTFRAWVGIDPGNLVLESNETNNITGAGGPAATSGVASTVTTAASRPDFRISSWEWLVTGGNRVRARARVLNNGSGYAGPLTVSFWDNLPSVPVELQNGRAAQAPNRLVTSVVLMPSGNIQEFTTAEFTLPGGTYRPWVMVDSNNAIPETNEGNNVAGLPGTGVVQLVSPVSDLPDLVLESFNVFVDNTSATYTIVVRNDGAEPSIPTNIGIFHFSQEVPVPPGDQYNLLVELDGMNPGDRKTIIFRVNNMPFGSYRSWAYVDPVNSVEEPNKGNNVSSEAQLFTIPGAGAAVPDLPDLRVRDFIITDNRNRFTFDITIENAGTNDAGPSVAEIRLNPVEPLPPFSETDNRQRFNVPGLAPGGSFSIFNVQTRNLATGSYALRLEVDRLATVRELNENNNIGFVTENRTGRSRSLDGLGTIESAPGVAPRNSVDPSNEPNLVVDLFYANVLGSGVELIGFVRNGGSADAPVSQLALYHNQADAPTSPAGADTLLNVPFLEPDATHFVSFPLENVPAGDYIAWAFSDPANAIVESNETDNVGGPAPYTTTAPPAGNVVTFEAGPVNSVPVTLRGADEGSEATEIRDQQGRGDGITVFTRDFAASVTSIRVTAPAIHQGRNFVRWINADTDAELTTDPSVVIAVSNGLRIRAVYDGEPILTLPTLVITY